MVTRVRVLVIMSILLLNLSVNAEGGRAPSAAASTIPVPTPVASTGDPAPIGGVFTGIELYDLNDSGGILFAADTDQGGSGLFLATGTGNTIQTIAKRGDPTPIGGTYQYFLTGRMNDHGEIVFLTSFNLNGGLAGAIFSVTNGSTTKIVAGGDSVPAPVGGTFIGDFCCSEIAFGLALSGSGEVVFGDRIQGGAASAGVFAASGSSISKVVALGDSVAGLTLSSLSGAAVDDQGNVVLGVNYPSVNDTAVLRADGASVIRLAGHGDPSPLGGTLSLVYGPQVSDTGDVVFSETSSQFSDASSILQLSGSGLTKVAATGDVTPAGGTYARRFYNYAINSTGDVAFTARIYNGTAQAGIFLKTSSGIEAIVTNGEALTIGDPPIRLNDHGDVAYRDGGGGGDFYRIMFVAGSGGGDGLIAFIETGGDTPGLYVVRPDGTGRQRLLAGNGLGDPRWSPDGLKIAFLDSGSLKVVNVADLSVRTLSACVSAFSGSVFGLHGSGFHEWSANSSKIATDNPCASAAVVVIDVATGTQSIIQANEPLVGIAAPSWHPALDKLIFHCTDGFHVCTANSDGSDRNALTLSVYAGLTPPRWSPDGSRFVVSSSLGGGGGGSVHLFNADGSGGTRIWGGITSVPTLRGLGMDPMSPSVAMEGHKSFRSVRAM